MASQYAGWQITGEKFFAMGSGPMRAARGREPVLEDLGIREQSSVIVGVPRKRSSAAGRYLQSSGGGVSCECGATDTADCTDGEPAGTVQVVARSMETALHKMYELGIDLRRVVSGFGIAPLPRWPQTLSSPWVARTTRYSTAAKSRCGCAGRRQSCQSGTEDSQRRLT